MPTGCIMSDVICMPAGIVILLFACHVSIYVTCDPGHVCRPDYDLISHVILHLLLVYHLLERSHYLSLYPCSRAYRTVIQRFAGRDKPDMETGDGERYENIG